MARNDNTVEDLKMSDIFNYFLTSSDENVTKDIALKYNISHLEALRKFIYSETYAMISDEALEMWDFGYPAYIDMWETEQITGEPRNSLYIRGDTV